MAGRGALDAVIGVRISAPEQRQDGTPRSGNLSETLAGKKREPVFL